jgi:hypothetical protein
MWMKFSVVALILTALLVVGCQKKDAKDSPISSVVDDDKLMLSSWAIGNSAWNYRLDINGANLNGVPFTLVIKYADNTELWCPDAVFTGVEALGTYELPTACVAHGGMSTGAENIFTFATMGSYTNTGTNLILCKNGTNNCLTYH